MTYIQEAHCPSCGAAAEVRNPAILQVTCEYCNTIFIIDKDGARDMGKKSRLSPAISGLVIGTSGKLLNKSFTVIGRVQYAYLKEGEEGGIWDEWCIEWDNKLAWLSEDMGKLSFQKDLPSPDIKQSNVQVNSIFAINKTEYRVLECGNAICKGTSGSLPFQIIPDETYFYADGVSLISNENISLEFDEEKPTAFVGQILKADEIKYEKSEIRVSKKNTEGLKCPGCGHPLEIRGNKEEILNIGCPACGSLVSLSEDIAKVIGKSSPMYASAFRIPLGAKGKLRDVEWMVIGRLRNDWVDDDAGYELTYLLYNEKKGYLWLGEENGHYYLAEETSSDRKESLLDREYAPKSNIAINNKRYQFFEAGKLKLSYVDGCLPWTAKIGDIVRYADLIAPPVIFTEERVMSGGKAIETEYYLSTYISYSEVASAFSVDIESPSSVGAAQPYQPIKGAKILSVIALLMSGWLCVKSVSVGGEGSNVLKESFSYSKLNKQEQFTSPFKIDKADETLEVKVSSDVNNSWVAVSIALYNATTQEILSDEDAGIEYYHGVEDGESWSEGSTSESIFWRVKDPGEYKILLTVSEADTGAIPDIHVEVEKGARRVYPYVLLFLFWPIIPILVWMRKKSFETSRWAPVMPESDDDGDDDDD